MTLFKLNDIKIIKFNDIKKQNIKQLSVSFYKICKRNNF